MEDIILAFFKFVRALFVFGFICGLALAGLIAFGIFFK